MWFLRNLDRLDVEMAAVEALRKEGWIKLAHWQVVPDDGSLRLEIDFQAGGALRKGWLVYPHVFPHAPPMLLPRDPQQLWSGHQWGAGGELCLQIRADNWRPRYTAADMLRSAQELLSTEGTVNADGRRERVPSAHAFTEGQTMGLLHFFRVVATPTLIAKIRERGDGCPARFRCSTFENCVVWTAVKLTPAGADAWLDPSIPAPLREEGYYEGFAVSLPTGDPRADLVRSAGSEGASVLWQAFSPEPLAGRKILLAVFPDSVQALHLTADTEKIFKCGMPTTDQSARLPERHGVLAGARIAVLGAGSMGSKVAMSLARSGAREFLIVDDDIVRDGNLVRNDLDWRAVGAHKAEALAERLALVHPSVKVRTRLQRLGGQMAAKTLQQALDDMSGFDLIVDTSGSDMCFNYAAAVAERARIPMVWGRVLAGGYGGYIARSRPGIEPDPHSVREQIDVWCSNPDFPPAPPAAAVDYGAEQGDGPPMIADDADVSIISGHLARLAIDLLTKPQHSDYPSSAYMIGLRAEWIFGEPFSTFGIPLVRVTEAEAAPVAAGNFDPATTFALTVLRAYA